MKGSWFTYLVAAAVVFGLVAWFMHRSETVSWRGDVATSDAAVFREFPVNDVAVVRLQGADGRVTLRRGPSGWTVDERDGYPANFETVSSLVRKIAGLKAVQNVPVAEADLGALALRRPSDDVPPAESGLLVELSDTQGKELASVIMGKTHQTSPAGARPEMAAAATGRYVAPGADPGKACLVTETFAEIRPSPAAWIDRDFVRPGMARRIEVKGASSDRSWTIEREAQGAPWQLAGAKKNESIDSAKLLSIDSMLGGMAVADAPDGPDDARTKPLADKPVTVVADSFDGIRYTFAIGEGGADNLPVKITAEALPGELAAEAAKERDGKLAVASRFQDRTVFIPRNFLQPFLAARSSLLAAAQAPAATPPATPAPVKPKKR